MLKVSLLGAGTVLHLERDAWSMAKRPRQATIEYAYVPPPGRPCQLTRALVPRGMQLAERKDYVVGRCGGSVCFRFPIRLYPYTQASGHTCGQFFGGEQYKSRRVFTCPRFALAIFPGSAIVLFTRRDSLLNYVVSADYLVSTGHPFSLLPTNLLAVYSPLA